METIKKLYRVNKTDISFLKFIIEAYEGIAVVSTVERENGIIAIYIPKGCEEEVDQIIASRGEKMLIEALQENQESQ